MHFAAPKVPLYSCATAAPMPAEPQRNPRAWRPSSGASRVRFTETIQRMHADGFRTFVEVGPSANLTGFIENVLQGQRRARRVARQPAAVEPGAAAARGRAALGGGAAPRSRRASGRPDHPGRRPRRDARRRNRARGSSRTRCRSCSCRKPSARPSRRLCGRRPVRTAPRSDPKRSRRSDGGFATRRSRPRPPKSRCSRLPQSRRFRRPAKRRRWKSAAPQAAAPATLRACVGPFRADAAVPRHAERGHDRRHWRALPSRRRSSSSGAALSVPAPHRRPRRRIASWPNATSTSTPTSSCASTCSTPREVSDLDPRLTALPVVPLAVSMEMLAEAAVGAVRRARPGAPGAGAGAELGGARRRSAHRRAGGAAAFRSRRRDPRRRPHCRRGRASRSLEAEVVLVAALPAAPVRAGAAARRIRASRSGATPTSTRPACSTGRCSIRSPACAPGTRAGSTRCLPIRRSQGFFGPGSWPVAPDQSGAARCDRPCDGLLDRPAPRHGFQLVPVRASSGSSCSRPTREDTAGSLICRPARASRPARKAGRFLTGDFTCTDPEGRLLFRATGWRDRFFDVPQPVLFRPLRAARRLLRRRC